MLDTLKMNNDLDAFKQFEHSSWEKVAGKYSRFREGLTEQFVDPLLRATAVSEGMYVLDVACGPGYLAAKVHRRGAIVIGIDFSENMIRIARQKYPTVVFIEGDAEDVPSLGEQFDRVLINFGLLHFAHPERAFAEARRVLRPGGILGFTVWAVPEVNSGARIITDAIELYADITLPMPIGPPIFQFCDQEACRRTLSVAGFSEGSLTFESHTVQWRHPTTRFWYDAEINAGVRTAALLELQSSEQRAAILEYVERRVEQYAVPGGFSIPMTAHIVTVKLE